MPVLVAGYHAARTGGDRPRRRPDAWASPATSCSRSPARRRSPTRAAAFDECLVLHADHTMNASTFAARVCAATLSDMHSAVVAAIGTLKGPLHGGANEQVMRTLRGDPGRRGRGATPTCPCPARARREAHGLRPPGLPDRGPAGDPPAPAVRRSSAAEPATRPTTRCRSRWSRTVLAVKGLYPNVDFFAASVYHALGIPTDLFTPVFAVAPDGRLDRARHGAAR